MDEILDRFSPPKAGSLNKIPLPSFEQTQLSNGIPVYFLPFGTVDVVEIQAIFRAGYVFQTKIGVASYTAANMREGTHSYSSLALAKLLDGYGAWLNHAIGEEGLSFKLATISKHIPQTLPLLKEVLIHPSFPEEEFLTMKDRAFQKIRVNEQKTRYLASRNFKHNMYGPSHPYGMHLGRDELGDITISDLKGYYQQLIYPGNFCLTVVGRFEKSAILECLESEFGSLALSLPNRIPSPVLETVPTNQIGFHFQQKMGIQASLSLGHIGMPRSHPDFYGMLVLNTLLGGFFGSRLMKNIREEKGYTYGIYSGWVALKHTGHFVVQSEVGNEYIRPTIAEIKKEIRKLMDEGTDEEELQLVKNYLLGQSISQRETPFQIGDILRFSIVNEIPFKEIDRKFEIIQRMNPDEIGDLANKYLKPEEMVEIVVGELPE